jgi:lysophospholipase L1-like esterase
MKIIIIGDSTAAHKTDAERPETGWGEFLHEFLPSTYEIKNYAKNGCSTKTFIKDGIIEKVSNDIKSKDYLIIQFGHNDSAFDSTRHTDVDTLYLENLEKFAHLALDVDATPIFISSITTRSFENGKINTRELDPYPIAMKKFCKSHHYHFIDMYEISKSLLLELGEEKSTKLYLHLKKGMYKNFPNGIKDNTHFNPYGAKLYASLIANELNTYLK